MQRPTSLQVKQDEHGHAIFSISTIAHDDFLNFTLPSPMSMNIVDLLAAGTTGYDCPVNISVLIG